MHLSLSLKDSLDNHPIYALPQECAKSIRRSFLRTGHAMSLSMRRKRSSAQTTFSKVLSRRTSKNSTLTVSSTNTSSSESHGTGSYPVSASSSFTHLSDMTTTTVSHETRTTPAARPQSLQPKTPENHPPPHVFGKADQGYSMFYLKLPNGNWMVRCRTADRKIIATYEVDGAMI